VEGEKNPNKPTERENGSPLGGEKAAKKEVGGLVSGRQDKKTRDPREVLRPFSREGPRKRAQGGAYKKRRERGGGGRWVQGGTAVHGRYLWAAQKKKGGTLPQKKKGGGKKDKQRRGTKEHNS